jgi:hypothetical protein
MVGELLRLILRLMFLRDGILASRNVPVTPRSEQLGHLVNPHSIVSLEVNSSPEIGYRQTFGTLRIMNAASSSGDDNSSLPSATKGKKL